MSNIVQFPYSDRVRKEKPKPDLDGLTRMTNKGLDNLCKDQRIDEQIEELDALLEKRRKEVKKEQGDRLNRAIMGIFLNTDQLS